MSVSIFETPVPKNVVCTFMLNMIIYNHIIYMYLLSSPSSCRRNIPKILKIFIYTSFDKLECGDLIINLY